MVKDAKRGRYISPEGSKTWEYVATFACSLLGLCIGSVVGWNSPTVVLLLAPDSPIPVTSSDISTLVAAVAVGHTLAPPLTTLVVDRIGRKNTILFSALPLIVSWTLIMVANSTMILYVARFVAGLALGLCICVTPMYIGEISSADSRGAGGALLGIMFNLGILFAFVVVPYLSITTMAAVFLAMSVFFLVFFLFMPDSPYYLAMKGRVEEAEEVLEKLRGKSDVSDELRTIMESLSGEGEGARNGGSIKEIFTVRTNRKAFFIIFLFVVAHHLGGYLTILTYGQLIFRQSSNGSFVSDHTANVIVGATQLTSATVTTFLVDRLGRKPLILFSGLVGGLCNVVIASYFYLGEYLRMNVSSYPFVLFAAAIVLVFAFNCGLAGLQMIMMSEIFATEIKAISTCVIGILGGLIATVVCKLYIFVAITLNYGHSPPFLVFAVVVWSCTALMLYLTPETKGKTFAEIQKELNE